MTPCRLVRKYSPEDEDNMFLRNTGIYVRIYTKSNPRKSTSSSCRCENLESDIKMHNNNNNNNNREYFTRVLHADSEWTTRQPAAANLL
jgi:hypothetical protein